MNIHAKPGTKVVFSYPNAGYPCDQKLAKKYLKINGEYTVQKTIVGKYHTDVYLVEVPGIAFNSVLFDDLHFDGQQK